MARGPKTESMDQEPDGKKTNTLYLSFPVELNNLFLNFFFISPDLIGRDSYHLANEAFTSNTQIASWIKNYKLIWEILPRLCVIPALNK